MTRVLSVVASGLVAVLGLLQASAGHAQTPPAVAQACRADFLRLCAGVRPGEGRGLSCLREHQSQLSSACKEQFDAAQACREAQPERPNQSETCRAQRAGR